MLALTVIGGMNNIRSKLESVPYFQTCKAKVIISAVLWVKAGTTPFFFCEARCLFIFFKHFSSLGLFCSISHHHEHWDWQLSAIAGVATRGSCSLRVCQVDRSASFWSSLSWLVKVGRDNRNSHGLLMKYYNKDYCWNIELVYTYFDNKITLSSFKHKSADASMLKLDDKHDKHTCLTSVC